MRKKEQPGDRIRRYQRKAAAARRIGQNKKCACGESRPEALVPGSQPIKCAACVRRRRGQTAEDNHHPAGRANNPTTIRVPVNDHRAELNPAQYDWPRETLENPDRSPLLAAAACTRGYVDTNGFLTEKLLFPNAKVTELLNAFLIEKFGQRWWTGKEFRRFVLKHRKSNAARSA